MDEIEENPNVAFPFTQINAEKFCSTDVSKIFNTFMYTVPDYWFKSETDLVEFSKTLSSSNEFLKYFFDILDNTIKKKYESMIIMTLRTNVNIIFVKVDSDNFMETIEKLIEMNIKLENYEQCSELVKLKEKIVDGYFPVPGKSLYYDAYEFWKPIYPKSL